MAKNRKKDRKSNMIKPSQLFYHFCQKKKKKPSQLIFKEKVFRNSSCQIE